MVADRGAIAARNNAEWCAAVWKAHGLTVGQRHGLWFCAEETPQYYPNVVTVDPGADPDLQVAFIRGLAERSDFEFSVKDSFAALPLASAGLTPLFSATWLWLEPNDPPPLREGSSWRCIASAELMRWEQAWRGDDLEHARTFPDALLDDPGANVIGGFDSQGRIVAGAIAYRTAEAIGLTNVFGSQGQVIAALASLLPPAPVVAYQPGEDLSQARRRGFLPLGPLTVWRSLA